MEITNASYDVGKIIVNQMQIEKEISNSGPVYEGYELHVQSLNLKPVKHVYKIHYRSKVWGHPDNFVSSTKTHFYLSNELKIE